MRNAAAQIEKLKGTAEARGPKVAQLGQGSRRESPAGTRALLVWRRNHSQFPSWAPVNVTHATLTRTASTVTQIGMNRT